MSNSSSDAASYAAYLNKLNSDIGFYFNIISSSIGIPCNLISIFIFARLMRNKTNMGFLYIWQCTIDMCVLLFFLLLFRSSQTFGISLPGQNNSSCSFLTFLRRFILHASSWIAILITLDRFVFVLYGHGDKFKFMKKKRYLTIIIMCTLTVITILDIPNFFFYVKSGSCTADFLPTISSDIISICIRTYIPFTIMIICNICMIQKILSNRRAATKQSSISRKELQFTLAVMAYDVYFLLFNFPVSVYYIMVDINTYSGALAGGDAVFKASYNLANIVTSNFGFLVQTISIFTYMIFNKLFRQELLALIGRILHIQSLSPIHPSQTHSTNSKTQTQTQSIILATRSIK